MGLRISSGLRKRIRKWRASRTRPTGRATIAGSTGRANAPAGWLRTAAVMTRGDRPSCAPRRAGVRDGSRYRWWSAGISWVPLPVRDWTFDAVQIVRNERAERRHRQACCGVEHRQDGRRAHAASYEAAIGKVAPLGAVISIGKGLGTLRRADDVAEGITLRRGGIRSNGESAKQRLEDKRIGCGKRNPRPQSLPALPQVQPAFQRAFQDVQFFKTSDFQDARVWWIRNSSHHGSRVMNEFQIRKPPENH